LASQGVFEEISPAVFTNTELSEFLRTGIKGSVRSLVIFRGSEFFYAPFGEILYSVETGRPAREKLCGMSAFEYLKQNLELARIFDDAMTNMAELIAPAVARGYDFGAWGSLMDIGGGNGILLATILKAHASLHGVLAACPGTRTRTRLSKRRIGGTQQLSILRFLSGSAGRLPCLPHEERYPRLG
jgi:hypothetical protein